MARRRKASPLGDIFEIVAMFPWWVGVAAAIALYMGLHAYASQATPPMVSAAQLSSAMSQTIFKTVAGVLQYILPLICLAAAATSAWKSSQRKSLALGVTTSRTAASLDGMTWQQFEILVGEAFRQKGYKVTELGGAGPDGGVDLVLSKGDEKFLVQCKQWKAFKVGVDVVRELYGLMAAKGAAGGFVVTSGKFTTDAQEFARGSNVTLLDGEKLFAMLQSAKAGIKKGSVAAAAPTGSPACPVCSSAMLRREARRGANAGNAFWGCTMYPKCRGTVSI
ncbi:MAG: restriction endonuclease [Burkholderiaceae bacterium]|nr:restriction endonuclease [Burkholderiaceae bacterium]